MKQKRVWLMSGPAGCGKSTYAKSKLDDKSLYISRDIVRFNLVKENEEYFSKETEVFNTFIDLINHALMDEKAEDIYIDATHLNKKSRDKTINRLNKEYIGELNLIIIKENLETILYRNSLRSGRECVPESVVINMFNTYQEPTDEERERFTHIIWVIGSSEHGK